MTVLYDQFGREIQVKKQPETREVAVTTVRDRWSSYPSSGLTPETLATILKEADAGDVYRQAELFEEMEEKDTHLFSQLQTRKNAVLGLEYDVLPHSDSAEDKKIRDFTADIISNLNDFDDALLDLLDAVGKGFSMMEIMWGVDGQHIVVGGLNWIHPKRAIFYERDNDMWQKSYEMPRILTEAEPVNGEVMPPYKMVYHRYKARSGYDTRAGVLRVCAWMYLFKNYSIKDWVAFAEVFGMPIRLGKYDPGASKDDKDALVAAIQSLGSDAAGIISKNTAIEFIEAVKNTGADNLFETLAVFCNKEMSKAILGQTLTSQEGSSGSYSLGQVHNMVRHDLIKADCEALAKTMRFQVIRPLIGYNFGWDKPLPKFKFAFEAPEDLKALSEVYKNLDEMGYPLTVAHVAERFKVPVPKKEETLLRDNTANADRKLLKLALKKALTGAQGDDLSPGGTLDRLGDKALNAADVGGLLAPIEALLASVNSLEELKDRLIDAHADMDDSELGALIQKALVLAELSGRFDATER